MARLGPDHGGLTVAMALITHSTTFAQEEETETVKVPGAPTDLKRIHADTGNPIVIVWKAPEDDGGSPVIGYLVEMTEEPDASSNWQQLSNTVSAGHLVYIDRESQIGTERHYRITAANPAGLGAASDTLAATASAGPPGPPQGLSAAREGSSVNLSWQAPRSNGGTAVTGYKVEVSEDDVDWTVLDSSASGTPYSHENVDSDTTFFYRVTAVNSAGGSAIRAYADARSSTDNVPVVSIGPKPTLDQSDPRVTFDYVRSSNPEQDVGFVLYRTGATDQPLTVELGWVEYDNAESSIVIPAGKSEWDICHYINKETGGVWDTSVTFWIRPCVDCGYSLGTPNHTSIQVDNSITGQVPEPQEDSGSDESPGSDESSGSQGDSGSNSDATPLTVSFVSGTVPDSHLGAGTTFTARVQFSEAVAVSYKVLRDDALQVTNGKAKKFKRVNGRSDLWEIHIAPYSNATVTLNLPTTSDCDASDAICTAADKPLSNTLDLDVAGPSSGN